MKLTGKIRYRSTWTKKLVLQVQFWYLVATLGDLHGTTGWRDARLSDFQSGATDGFSHWILDTSDV